MLSLLGPELAESVLRAPHPASPPLMTLDGPNLGAALNGALAGPALSLIFLHAASYESRIGSQARSSTHAVEPEAPSKNSLGSVRGRC